jgi:hypothetical protein
MKTIFIGALSSALLVGAVPAVAQTAPAATLAPPAPTAPIVVAAGTPQADNVLRTGTPIELKMAETLTTKGKKLEAGYLAHLEVLDPVLVNGVVVIPAGSPAVAEITDVRNKGMWGKSGRIAARMLYVTVGDRKIRLRGVFDDKGVTVQRASLPRLPSSRLPDSSPPAPAPRCRSAAQCTGSLTKTLPWRSRQPNKHAAMGRPPHRRAAHSF